MGRPKALVLGEDGEPWVARAVRVLLGAGCARVVVVLGAQADDAAGLVPRDVRVTTVVAHDWADGLSASLRAGLTAAVALDADEDPVTALVVVPVDLPGLTTDVVRRVVTAPVGGVGRAGAEPDVHGVDARVLRQAVYGGRPGHPVLLGRAHWAGVAADAHGDRGARHYLTVHGGTTVECGDLFDGHDVDHPAP